MIKYIKLLRIHQWLKNFFIFMPLFFSGQLFDFELLCSVIAAFFAFCFISSSVYCFNDILDVKLDRLHPIKQKRPVASGEISQKTAYFFMFLCLILGFLILIFTKAIPTLLLILGIYYVINIAYCLLLKKIALVDVFIVSFGFVLRIIAGGIATDIWLSHWIIIMTFLLALFLALAKRRDDLVIYDRTKTLARKNIRKYNFDFINSLLIITATITVISYIMYTISPEVVERFNSNYVYVTSLFVIAGVFRYLQIIFVHAKSDSPTMILIKDVPIQLCILGWIAAFGIIVYF